MKRDSRIFQDNEIDLREIIKTLWNEKILILSISIIFMVAGYVYGALQPKIYKTEITIREASPSLFQSYRSIFPNEYKFNEFLSRELNDQFKLNLLSVNTLVQFVENNNAINDFKNHLKKKNISSKNYFQPQLGRKKLELVVDKKYNIQNKYSLTYEQPLQGDAFLDDYVIFVKQKTVNALKKQLIEILNKEINFYQENLEISTKLGLDKPMLSLKEHVLGNNDASDELFSKGKIVLTQKIIYLNKLLSEAKDLTLDYNPILENASPGSLIPKPTIINLETSLLFGFIFSIVAIYLKAIFKTKYID